MFSWTVEIFENILNRTSRLKNDMLIFIERMMKPRLGYGLHLDGITSSPDYFIMTFFIQCKKCLSSQSIQTWNLTEKFKLWHMKLKMYLEYTWILKRLVSISVVLVFFSFHSYCFLIIFPSIGILKNKYLKKSAPFGFLIFNYSNVCN